MHLASQRETDNGNLFPVTPSDLAEIAALEARALGPGRFARTAYRIREGASSVSPYSVLLREDGKLIGAVRLTPVTIGGKPGALLLGPITVAPERVSQGVGRTLLSGCLSAIQPGDIELVVLVGDAPYYGRHGFVPVPPGRFVLPGPVNPARILAREIAPGALAHFEGLIAAA